MLARDFRHLVFTANLSNREAGEVLAVDERLVRRLKSGEEQPTPEIESRLIECASDVLAAQMIRSLNLAAGGQVNIATLRISESTIHVKTELSPPVAGAVRNAVLKRLASAGLTIERTHQ